MTLMQRLSLFKAFLAFVLFQIIFYCVQVNGGM